jgi:hypothetical protein
MTYLKSSSQKSSRSGSVSEDLAVKSGISMPAIPALQRVSVEEEEPLQGKFETVQREGVEEEELQMKPDPAQRAGTEEEELQMKQDPVQRAAIEEEEPLQGKFETVQREGVEEEELQMKQDPVQRAAIEEEEPVQMKSNNGSAGTVQLEEGDHNGGLPSALRSGVESLSGMDLSDVKVYYNSDKPAQLNALAYAQGSDIHVASGQEKHLGHEAWHVVQQRQGRVQPTMQMKMGIPVNDDEGLETEADVMGAKAASVGADLISRKAIQRKAAASLPQTAPVQFAPPSPADVQWFTDNPGIARLADNSPKVLQNPVWNNLLAQSDDVGTAGTVIGVVGGATGLSGDITHEATGSSARTEALQKTKGSAVFDAKAEGDMLATIGSSISVITSTMAIIKKVYSAKNGDESKIEAAPEVLKELTDALKSGFEAGLSIQKYVNGSVAPGLLASLPGLGIAVAAVDMVINIFKTFQARQAEKQMTGVSAEYRAVLTTVLEGKDPEHFPKLFKDEKRGKMFNRIKYLRLLPRMLSTLDMVKEATGLHRTIHESMFKKAYDIPDTVNFDALYMGIRFYEMGSKMQEINQKRKVAGARNILADVLKIAGEIAVFFPGGQPVAGALKGAVAGAQAAASAAKFIQGLARKHETLGGDSNRSEKSKHKQYIEYTKSIYYYMETIPKPATASDKLKLQKGEALLEAAGVFLPKVYRTNYEEPESVAGQVSAIVEGMKAGR